jgi:hypothetical protein
MMFLRTSSRQGILVVGAEKAALFLPHRIPVYIDSPQCLLSQCSGLKELTLVSDLAEEFHSIESIPPTVRPWERKVFLKQKQKNMPISCVRSVLRGKRGIFFGFQGRALGRLDPWVQQLKKSSLFLSGIFSWAQIGHLLVPVGDKKEWRIVVTKTLWSGVRLSLFQGKYLLLTRLVPHMDVLEAELSQLSSYLPRLGLDFDGGNFYGFGFEPGEISLKVGQKKVHFIVPNTWRNRDNSQEDWKKYWSQFLLQNLAQKARFFQRPIALKIPELRSRYKQQNLVRFFQKGVWGTGIVFSVLAFLNWSSAIDLELRERHDESQQGLEVHESHRNLSGKFLHPWGQWLEKSETPLNFINNIPLELRQWGVVRKISWSQSGSVKAWRRNYSSAPKIEKSALQISVQVDPLRFNLKKAEKDLVRLFSEKFFVRVLSQKNNQNLLSGVIKEGARGVQFHQTKNRLRFKLLLRKGPQS